MDNFIVPVHFEKREEVEIVPSFVIISDKYASPRIRIKLNYGELIKAANVNITMVRVLLPSLFEDEAIPELIPNVIRFKKIAVNTKIVSVRAFEFSSAIICSWTLSIISPPFLISMLIFCLLFYKQKQNL